MGTLSVLSFSMFFEILHFKLLFNFEFPKWFVLEIKVDSGEARS